MNSSLQALSVALPVAYLLAAFLYAMDFGAPRAPRVVGLRRAALAAAAAMHVGLFVVRGEQAGGFPRLDTWAAVSAIALCTVLLFAGVSFNVAQKSIGGVVLGIVFAMQLVSSCFAPLYSTSRATDLVTLVHVATSTLASSAVVLSGILGGLYLLLYRQMRRRSFGALFRQLPDLQTLAHLTRRSALAGFLLLTIGLNVGIGWAHAEALAGFSYTDPYVLLVMALWIHFGIVAFSRWIPGLTAWRASFAAAAGFVVLLLAVLLTLTRATFHLQG